MSATDVLHQHRTPIEKAARAGYVARGAVYLIIGYFAAKAAYSTAQPMGSKDAVEQVFGSVGGIALLVVLVAALGAFAIWRLMQATFDFDRHGTGAKGIVVRIGLFASGLSYGALAVFAGLLAAGARSGGGGVVSDAISAAYDAGYGVAATYIIAALLVGVGAAHVVKGVQAGFEKYMTLPPEASWLRPVCRFGLIARGFTFILLGFLVFTGAASYDGGETPGLETALRAMAGWTFGWVYLAVTGLGLVSFGVYALAQARYRRIHLRPAT
ncbi:MAG: DUF1206 domain-containing protein [Rhizobiaceae bacterium]|nr:DUF1206 domain-containing protein [Rhizobiaceae bacterium]